LKRHSFGTSQLQPVSPSRSAEQFISLVELLLDSISCPDELDAPSPSLLLDISTGSLELDSTSAELLDSFVELLLDCGVTSEEDDSSTLDEESTTLLLDSSLALRMTDDELLDFSELDDSSFFEDEDFDFSLLLDRSSTGAEDDDRTELLDCSVTLEEDDSTPGSSFDDADELSSHPTTANVTMPNAANIFFISPPSPQRPVI
jgi:hypothetical protein